MPQYSYKAKSGPGEIKSGTIIAENQAVVAKKLRRDGLFPLSVQELGSPTQTATLTRVTSRDISEFTRQLANLVHAGFPLARALATVKQQVQHAGLVKLVSSMHEKIEKGATFSETLAAYPALFSSFYVSMVRIGEASGKLDQTLERLADFKEREDETIAQVKAALTYPAFLMVVGAAMVVVLMTFFVPRLMTLFSDVGQALPMPTQIVMAASGFLSRFWLPFTVVAIAAVLAARTYLKSEKNRLLADALVLQTPFLHKLIRQVEISRFSYALAVLLESGIPMYNALAVVAFSVNNRMLRKKISSFQERISKGASLSSCFSQDKFFPAVLANMAAVGEESGTLTDMLFRVAKTFEAEVNRTLRTLVSLLEPILILCIGAVVVLIVFAILLPIFQLEIFTE